MSHLIDLPKKKKLKIFQKSSQEEPNFLNHIPNGSNLQKIWDLNKVINNKQDKLSWFFQFAELFLKSYSNWKPEIPLSKKLDVISAKLYEEDQLHHEKLIIETLQILYDFLESLSQKIEILEISCSSLISIEMILILSRSIYNQKNLLKYQLFLFLENIAHQVIFRASSLLEQKRFEEDQRDEHSCNFFLVEYLISKLIAISNIYINSPFDQKTMKSILPIIIQFSSKFLLRLVQFRKKFIFNQEQHDLLFDLIDLFRILGKRKLISPEYLLFLFKTITPILETPDFTLPLPENFFKRETTKNAQNTLDYYLSLYFPPSKFSQTEQERKSYEFQIRIVVIDLVYIVIKDNAQIETLVCNTIPLTIFTNLIFWVFKSFHDPKSININNNNNNINNINMNKKNIIINSNDQIQSEINTEQKDSNKNISETKLELPQEIPVREKIYSDKFIPLPKIPSSYLNNLKTHQLFANLKEICLESKKNKTLHKSQNQLKNTKKKTKINRKKLQFQDLLLKDYQVAIDQIDSNTNINNINIHIHQVCYLVFMQKNKIEHELIHSLRLYTLDFFAALFTDDFSQSFYKNQIWKTMILEIYEDSSPQNEIVKSQLFQLFTHVLTNYPNHRNQISILLEIVKGNTKRLDILYDITKYFVKILKSKIRLFSQLFFDSSVFEFYSVLVDRLSKITEQQINTVFDETENTKELYFQVRYQVFRLFDILFSDPIACSRALEINSWNINIISHIFEKKTKTFVLNMMYRMMCSINPPFLGTYEKFFYMYLELVLSLSQLYKLREENDQDVSDEQIQRYMKSSRKNTVNIPKELPEPPVVYIQDLLKLASESIKSNREALQKLMPDIGIFEMLISLLTIPGLNTKVSHFVVQTLTELLYCSYENVSRFDRIIGFQVLGSLILRSQMNNPDERIFYLLLNLLVNTGKFDKQENFEIKNHYLISMLFNLYFKSENLMLFSKLLDLFLDICKKSIHNTLCCYNAELISFLSETLPKIEDSTLQKKVSRLIMAIARLGISIKDMHILISNINKFKREDQISYLFFLFKMLQEMAKEYKKPQPFSFFDFHLGHLSLPTIEEWPQNGWSFCTWIYFQSLENYSQNHHFDQDGQTIFSFLNDEGYGIEFSVLLKINLEELSKEKAPKPPQIVFILNLNTQTENTSLSFDFDLPKSKWAFVAISQSPLKTYNSSTKIQVYFNHHFKEQYCPKYLSNILLTKNRIASKFSFESKLRNSPNFVSRSPSLVFQEIEQEIDKEIVSENDQEENLTSKSNNSNNSVLTTKSENKTNSNSQNQQSVGNVQEIKLDGTQDPKNIQEDKDIITQEEKLNEEDHIMLQEKDKEKDSFFLGQMGTIYFFQEFLDSNFLMEFSHLILKDSIPFDLLDPTEPLDNPNFEFFCSLSSKLFLVYHPRAITKKKYCLDLSQNSTTENLALISGMVTISTKNLEGIIESLGGIPVFFPLISHFDILFSGLKNTLCSKEYEEIKYLDQTFKIFADIIYEVESFQTEFLQRYSFSLISDMISNVDPLFISTGIIQIAQNILQKSRKIAFINDIFFNFLLGFDLWVYCSFEVQKELFRLIAAVLNNSIPNDTLKSITFPTSKIVEILILYYWIIPESSSRATETKYNNKTNREIKRTLTVEETRKLRDIILSLLEERIEILARNIPRNYVEIKTTLTSTIYQFCNLENKKIYVDLLKMFVNLLSKEKISLFQSPEPILDSSLIDPLVYLLSTPEPSLRKLVLESLYQLDQILSQKRSLPSKFDINHGYAIVDQLLLENELTSEIANFLFEIMLTPQDPKAQEKLSLEKPYIFFTILNFIKKYKNIHAINFVKRLKYELSKEKGSALSLTNLTAWQLKLLDLVSVEDLLVQEQTFYQSPSNETIVHIPTLINNAVFDFFEFIHTENILNESKGFQVLFQTIAYIGLSIADQSQNEQIILRRILFDLCHGLASQSMIFLTPNFTHSILRNITTVIVLIQRYFYFDFSYILIQVTKHKKTSLAENDSQKKESKAEIIKLESRIKHTHDHDFVVVSGLVDFLEKSNFWIMLSILSKNRPKNSNLIRSVLLLYLHFLPTLDPQKCREFINKIKLLILFFPDNKIVLDVVAILFNCLNFHIYDPLEGFNFLIPERKILSDLSDVSQDNDSKIKRSTPDISDQSGIDLDSDSSVNQNKPDTQFQSSETSLEFEKISESFSENPNIQNLETMPNETKQIIFEYLLSVIEENYFFLGSFFLDENNRPILLDLIPETLIRNANKQKIKEENFKNRQWHYIWTEYLQPTLIKIDRETRTNFQGITHKIYVLYQENLFKLYENRSFLLNQKKMNRVNIIQKTKDFIENDKKKIQKNQILYNRKIRFIAKKWKRLSRQLMFNKFIWEKYLPEALTFEPHFKLDKVEDKIRVRRKMRLNYIFTNHLNRQSFFGIKPPKEQNNNENNNNNNENNNENENKDSRDVENLLQFEDLKEKEEQEKKKKLKEEQQKQLNEIIEYMNQDPNVLAVKCELINGIFHYEGILEITQSALNFYIDFPSLEDDCPIQISDKYWKIDDIIDISKRRLNFQPTSLEILFRNRKSYFFHFSEENFLSVTQKLLTFKHLGSFLVFDQHENLKAITKQWKNSKISNFEYLLKLNFIAGRSFNDLSQYPVFPWIFSDYESNEIRLEDPSFYRKLSKPIGALNKKRLKIFIQRYKNLADHPQLDPPFYYGSHYSSPAGVVYYLVRLEPYTSFSIHLHGGRFDHPDRLFGSIGLSWKSCLNNTGDLKELIPEFFYLPELLINDNNFDFGISHTNEQISNVTLPNWAKSPKHFIEICKKGLESEYVSQHLNRWIDLIFGFKQRGKEAEKAYNVFYFLTYDDSYDIKELNKPEEIKRIKSQIENFGQVPMQLFFKSHPRKKMATQQNTEQTFTAEMFNSMRIFSSQISETAVLHLKFTAQTSSMSWMGVFHKLYSLNLTKKLMRHRWIIDFTASITKSPFNIEVDPLPKQRKIGVSFADGVNLRTCYLLSKDCSFLFSCGYWDNSFKITSINPLRLVASVNFHKDIVTCFAFDSSNILATGSRDYTVAVWKIFPEKKPFAITRNYSLSGHQAEITSLAINSYLDMIVTGSKDGTCRIYSLYSGKYSTTLDIKQIYENQKNQPEIVNQTQVSMISIFEDGRILVFSVNRPMISIFTLNSELILSSLLDESITCWSFLANENFIVTGSKKGLIKFLKVSDLSLVHKYDVSYPVSCLLFSPESTYFFAGCENGKLLVGVFTYYNIKTN